MEDEGVKAQLTPFLYSVINKGGLKDDIHQT
jgi:hypothetical protein